MAINRSNPRRESMVTDALAAVVPPLLSTDPQDSGHLPCTKCHFINFVGHRQRTCCMSGQKALRIQHPPIVRGMTSVDAAHILPSQPRGLGCFARL